MGAGAGVLIGNARPRRRPQTAVNRGPARPQRISASARPQSAVVRGTRQVVSPKAIQARPVIVTAQPVSSDEEGDDAFELCNSWADSGPSAQLRAACKTGAYQRITDIIIDEHFSVDGVVDEEGTTVLMTAAECGETRCIQALLALGAALEVVDSRGNTALLYAALQGRTQTVQMLLKASANVEARSTQGFTALLTAAANGHTVTADALVSARASVLMVDEDGKTSLHWAVCMGHRESAIVLLERDADPNALIDFDADPLDIDQTGDSALHLTAKYGHLNAAEALLKASADINVVNSLGETVAETAAKCGHSAIAALLDEWVERPRQQARRPRRRSLKTAWAPMEESRETGQVVIDPDFEAEAREEYLKHKAKEEGKREASDQHKVELAAERLQFAKAEDEAKLREEALAEEVSRLRAELLESTKALEESSDAQQHLVKYQRELRLVMEHQKSMTKSFEQEKTKMGRQVETAQRHTAQLEAEKRILQERNRRLRGDYGEETPTAELDAIIAELEAALNRAKGVREQRREDENRLLHAEHEQKLCVVCCNEPKTILFGPCHHLCACDSCAQSLVDCPICRQPISSRTPVFM